MRPAILLVPLVVLGLALPGAPPAHAAHPDDGDLLLLDGGAAQVSLYGLLQTWAIPYTGDEVFTENGDPSDRAGFRLRRARFGLDGVAWGLVDFQLTINAGQSGMKLLDAFVGYRGFTSFYLTAGARKVPFSRFALNSSTTSALADRPYAVRAMVPFRQVGLTVEGDIGDGLFGFAAGVYNGFARGDSFHDGYSENAAFDGNRVTNLAYVGRVTLAPLGPVRAGLADLDKGPLVLGVGGSFFYDDGATVSTLGIGADLLVQVAGLHLAAELLYDDASPVDEPLEVPTTPTDTTRMAVVGEVGYVILASQLGVTARVEWIDDNTELDNNGDELIITGGLQYYFRRHHVKAGLEFTHRTELEGISLDNDSLVLSLQLAL